MRLKERLQQKETDFINRWFELVAGTYPAETTRLLTDQKDPFANPVGSTIREGLAIIYSELYQEMDTERIAAVLDPIIRIRAIQDFTPSKAVGFVFALKQILKKTLEKELQIRENEHEWQRLETNIDRVGLMAFDIYMQCREKIYEIRATEIQNRTYNAFKRAGLVADLPGEDPNIRTVAKP